jgi:hypothetical protein
VRTSNRCGAPDSAQEPQITLLSSPVYRPIRAFFVGLFFTLRETAYDPPMEERPPFFPCFLVFLFSSGAFGFGQELSKFYDAPPHQIREKLHQSDRRCTASRRLYHQLDLGFFSPSGYWVLSSPCRWQAFYFASPVREMADLHLVECRGGGGFLRTVRLLPPPALSRRNVIGLVESLWIVRGLF